MDNINNWTCQTCGNVGLADGSDGFFYCLRCGSQAEDIIDTGVADEDFVDKGGDTGGAIYLASHRRQRSQAIKVEPISQYDSFYDSQSQLFRALGLDDETPQRQDNRFEGSVKVEEGLDYGYQFDGVESSVPADFGGSGGVRVPSFEDYYNEIRIRYVMGLQLMIEFQCEALVKEFKVNPLICGLVGPVWLRFVSGTGVFDDDWADEVIHESEMQRTEEPADYKPRAKYSAEPHNMYGQRAVMIWYRSLRKRIPLACTIAISFLACHIAREAVLATDIMKWTIEGKLPYFSAFCQIEKRMGRPSSACPISSMVMFRPSHPVSLQKLESLAASIAQSVGLELPPVNFYATAFRYLQELSLPGEKILPHACHIYEWSMPPDLWLSTSDLRLPTRVCVMSILIVAIRILYNLNGFGEWERNLSHNGGAFVKLSSGSIGKESHGMDAAFASDDNDDEHHNEDLLHSQKSELDAAQLLHHLQAIYNEIAEKYGSFWFIFFLTIIKILCFTSLCVYIFSCLDSMVTLFKELTNFQYYWTEYSKDLSTYLQYCKDVAFAGLEPSFENHEEEKMIECLWNFYMNEKDSKPAEPVEQSDIFLDRRRSRVERCTSRTPNEKIKREECFGQPLPDNVTCLASDAQESMDIDESPECSSNFKESETNEQTSAETLDDEAIRKLKLDMEENKFCYIPPRVKVKRFDYLHYVRKKDKGALTYVAHADYYILLRACARVAQVDIRIMHMGVLILERRLAWLEKRIDRCLHVRPSRISCRFCRGEMTPENASVDEQGASNLTN